MKQSNELKQQLLSIHKKSYPAYKSLAGSYDFKTYVLRIDHVQGDPFAAPSHLSILLPYSRAGFSQDFLTAPETRIALQDYLLRQFGRQMQKFTFQAQGSGKSGLLSVSRPGQEILERTACEISDGTLTLRFSCGFPANGRTINALELEKILFTYLPQCVEKSCFYRALPAEEVKAVRELALDQAFIRKELPRLGLVAFVADGSILPRESGVSDRPMKNSVPFLSPESLAITLQLPHKGAIRGLGIRRGITLIAGGGYHGKSTLLQALQRGVYNHIAGDGREYVITDQTAIKLRAEDGRKVTNVDISLFINDLPNGKNTRCFSTLDASGSTSQAANIMEGIEAGSRVLLIDEDTSATNFMIRDSLMQSVITRDKEPITPFLERARDLYEKAGISTVLVVGSCGSYFYIADTILQMDSYRPRDITASTREILSAMSEPSGQTKALPAPAFRLPAGGHKLELDRTPAVSSRRSYHSGRELAPERLKIKTLGKDSFLLGKETMDLRYLEQLVDAEQTTALAYCLRYAKEQLTGGKQDAAAVVQALLNKIQKDGLASLCASSYVPAGLAMPRIQEIYACLDRY